MGETIAAYVFYIFAIVFFSFILAMIIGTKIGWIKFDLEELEPEGMNIVTTRDVDIPIMEVLPGVDIRDVLVKAKFKLAHMDHEFIRVEAKMASFHVFADSDIDRLVNLYKDLKPQSTKGN